MHQRTRIWTAIIFAVTAITLYLLGRHPICTCGKILLWAGARDSPETSQMLADWYSPSHVVHGLLFYAALRWVGRSWPIEQRFLLALAVEAAWEILENTPLIINRYRQTTAALGYTGDSIINSLSDMSLMVVGFYLAYKLPVRVAVVLLLALEIIPLFTIRDNLTLNVWELIAPNRALEAWQAVR